MGNLATGSGDLWSSADREEIIMWDVVDPSDGGALSHAVPCPRCAHDSHQFLSCSDTCACEPPAVPWLPHPAQAA